MALIILHMIAGHMLRVCQRWSCYCADKCG